MNKSDHQAFWDDLETTIRNWIAEGEEPALRLYETTMELVNLLEKFGAE